MNIQKYRALIKTVDCGSFTKAAQMLHYSQSAISRMISDLEQEWGVSLLERGRFGVRLTSDGLTLLPYVRRVCNEYQILQREVHELTGLQSGLIRIGTFSSVATHWLPKMIHEFQKKYPKIDYELLLGDYTEIEDWILEGRVDCGFVRLPTATGLESISLEKDPLMVILPEKHPLADCSVFPIQALMESPFMLLEKNGKAEVSDLLEKYQIRPNIRFTTWDDYAIMSMVESGLGISILPKLILQRIPYRVVIKALDVPAFRTIGVAVKDHEHLSLVAKTFLEYLAKRALKSI